ncbi:hypothetical protein IX51_04420 [uncultured archaeon]|nr:hypothetical protein IX51_04420 [uncultured archaeon]HKJ96221.1 hypothetical protein [Thermoplasmataceae archaeon]
MSFNSPLSLKLNSVFQKAAKHLSEVDERLGKIIEKLGVLEFSPNEDLFFSLVESVLSQQLTPKAADSIIKRFVSLFPGGYVTPYALLGLNDDEVRSCGISKQKISYIRNVAECILDGSISSNHFNRMTDEEIISQLVRIKGVGTWTAKMVLIFSLGRTDVLPHEDLGVINSIRTIYHLKDKPDRETIERISENWHPYCSVASLYLWKLKDDLSWEKQ